MKRKTPGPAGLADAIKLFEQGRFAEAAEGFKNSIRQGEARGVREFLESAAHRPFASGRPRPPLKEALDARDYPKAFKEAERAFAEDRPLAYRLLRDLWLEGVFDIPPAQARSPWGCFFLSSEAWKHGHTLDALRWLQKASTASPRFFWMRYFIAELLMRRADLFAMARAEIDQVIKACPWLWEARCLRAEILWTLGVAGPLKGLADIKVSKNSQSSFLAWRGALNMWTGRYAQALPDLDASAALSNPDAPCWRGGARVMLGRLDEAVKDLTVVLNGDPHDHEARIWRGEAYRRLGLYKESLADLNDAITRSEDAVWAYVNRALVHLELGDKASAMHDFIRLAPPRDLGEAGVKYDDDWSLDERRMRAVLDRALKSALGCRRSDPHLNLAWMRHAGIPLPARPTPQVRLLYWLQEQKVPAPPELVFGTDILTEDAAKDVLSRRGATSAAKARATSRKSRA